MTSNRTFQIWAAYSSMERSLENLPVPATLRMLETAKNCGVAFILDLGRRLSF
jgi:hypothetical protein